MVGSLQLLVYSYLMSDLLNVNVTSQSFESACQVTKSVCLIFCVSLEYDTSLLIASVF